MMTVHHRRQLLRAAMFVGAWPGTAPAQAAWPTAKPITLIVPYSAGGNMDFYARLIASKLGERLRQVIVIDNTTGAGGVVGVAKAVNAAPDGYTLVAAPDSVIALGQLINPTAYKFDPLKDLAPVGMLATAPMVLVARRGLGVQSYADLVKLAKASPGKYTYATSGVGTVLHLAMELLGQRSGITLTHVPYRGGAQIVSDLMADQVDMAMLVGAGTIQYITSGRLNALGVTDARRLDLLPQIPTFDEMVDFKGYVIVTWTGIFAPAGTPTAIVQHLNEQLNAVLKDPMVLAKLAEQGALPGSGSAEDLARLAQAEYLRNQQIVQSLNITK